MEWYCIHMYMCQRMLIDTQYQPVVLYPYMFMYKYSTDHLFLLLDCDDDLEPVPQQSNLRRSHVIMRRGVNKDSSRRSGTLIEDPLALPPALSSAAALHPTMLSTKERSATLAVPRQRQPCDDPREKRLVASEAFVSREVPVEFKRIEQFNIVSVACEPNDYTHVL